VGAVAVPDAFPLVAWRRRLAWLFARPAAARGLGIVAALRFRLAAADRGGRAVGDALDRRQV